MAVGNALGNKKGAVANTTMSVPPQPFSSLSFLLNDKKLISMSAFVGKKVLLVNTASDCGFTPQFAELQQLQDKFKDSLVVIGFPSNDFKEQEKGGDTEIQAFCQVNFGVQFALAAKSGVIKQPGQNDVFSWLTHKEKNGWYDEPPAWNFTKYLVNERGILTHSFASAVSPLDAQVMHLL